jgi:hypothetical protein
MRSNNMKQPNKTTYSTECKLATNTTAQGSKLAVDGTRIFK